MKVNITFDTELERLENLKKLVRALQELIAHREGKPMQSMQKPSTVQEQKIAMTAHPASSMPPQIQSAPVQQAEKKEEPKKTRTSGGCRVIPYEDMSGKMADIFSGRRA